MGRLVFLVCLVMAVQWCQAQQDGSDWARRSDTGSSEVVTNLHFYFHDTVSGNNPSAVRVAGTSTTSNSPTLFGALLMVDDPLTVGPDRISRLVGNARGLYGSASHTDMGLIMVINYGFTDGIYNGSSFSILSINPPMQPVREMSIVGGTGLFRLARGYALARTYWFDASGDAIVEYNVTITTYI
uniref:Dirigent protein n=1 Tax=Eucommia ulmoides TaxID=4392 RepID=A0A3G2LMN3_EUCUL|nr:dirigent protein 2 [Eucommia ulmoides]